jgi:hypothetical protein
VALKGEKDVAVLRRQQRCHSGAAYNEFHFPSIEPNGSRFGCVDLFAMGGMLVATAMRKAIRRFLRRKDGKDEIHIFNNDGCSHLNRRRCSFIRCPKRFDPNDADHHTTEGSSQGGAA